jgi:hypothetical protein
MKALKAADKTKAKKPAKPKKEKTKVCSVKSCKKPAVTHGYCRGCYIKNWKHIQFDKHVKAERRLNAYIDRLSKKYPKDYLEIIKQGLENEDTFKKTVEELNVDVEEPSETDTEFLEKFMRALKGE